LEINRYKLLDVQKPNGYKKSSFVSIANANDLIGPLTLGRQQQE